MDILRRHRYPVAGQVLADELNVSLRTLYRDIESLKCQGAEIEGEAGLGYVLRPGFMLPPMMFSQEEIEALVLGSRFVAGRTDEPLGLAARSALSKIMAVLPDDLRRQCDDNGLLMAPSWRERGERYLPQLRAAIRGQKKIRIDYEDGESQKSTRIIWPFGLAFFDNALLVMAWCEIRADFRHFRSDRIAHLEEVGESYKIRRAELLRQWREQLNLPLEKFTAAGN